VTVSKHLHNSTRQTYSKLANLHIVDAEDFLFLARTELENGEELSDKVEAAEDHARSDKRVCAASNGIGKLVAELDPVMVEPATGDDGETIEMRNIVA
jgi:hypothetical protein